MNPAAAKAICKLVMDTLDKMESSKVQIELPKKENPHGR